MSVPLHLYHPSYCYGLNWPTNPFKPHIPSLTLSERASYTTPLEDVFESWFLDDIGKAGHEPLNVLLFYYAEKTLGGIHVDTNDGFVTRYSVNWVFAKETMMAWYSLKPGVRGQVRRSTEGKIIYYAFEPEDTELLFSTPSKGPMLVNTGVPHTAGNVSDGSRLAISLRFKDRFSSWPTIVNKFNNSLLPLQ